MTRKSAFFLAVVAIPTCYAVFIAMRSGLNPDDYYFRCFGPECEFAPPYMRLALTALFMAAEGFLVFYALAGSRFWPIWARAGAGLISLAPVSVVLFFTMMDSPNYRFIHLRWVEVVAQTLLAIMAGGLIVGLVRTLWEWLGSEESGEPPSRDIEAKAKD